MTPCFHIFPVTIKSHNHCFQASILSYLAGNPGQLLRKILLLYVYLKWLLSFPVSDPTLNPLYYHFPLLYLLKRWLTDQLDYSAPHKSNIYFHTLTLYHLVHFQPVPRTIQQLFLLQDHLLRFYRNQKGVSSYLLL
ncbi:MAG: hypothetical protein A4E27_00224 [Methanobacterium sp. PtaU1.Bin242]|nr:MAG: hypothetical protein A4E27_00224 [Methanobacterium sp. PtaU1.Bin242]